MEAPKEFNIVVYKDFEIERFEKGQLIFRNDVKMIFKAKLNRKTTKNSFYYYYATNAKGKLYKDNSFLLEGRRCFLDEEEDWIAYSGNSKACVISIEIHDAFQKSKTIRLVNRTTKIEALQQLLQYVKDLNRLGSHQAVYEIIDLKEKIAILEKKVNRYKLK